MTSPSPEASSSSVDLRGGPRKRSLLIAAVALVAGGGGLAGMVLFQDDPDEDARGGGAADAAPSFDYGEYAGTVENLRTIRRHKPCDARNAIELGETLNRAGDHEGAIETVDEFIEECGELRRILWVKVGANEDLERWDEVVKVTTSLIEGAPQDSDYWWWRGRAQENLEEIDRAASDYRHSVARGPNKYGSSRFAKLVGERAPCEGAFAMHSYLSRQRRRADWARRDFQEAYLAGDCDRLAGSGSAQIEFDPEAPLMRVSARVNGKKGKFIVEREAAYTTLRRSFAEAVGAAPNSEDAVQIYVAGGFTEAHLAQAKEVSVGRAKASEVAVAVVDDLPAGADGFLGESFLWRFRVTSESDRLILAPMAGR